MSYLALYRTLRPQNFNQVIGQDHIIKTLINQLDTNRVNHAYLFCGTRGTGKTSTAKIFAKVLNCENPINNIACNNCEMCTTFNQNRNFNIVEIDAASNSSVNNVRELREEIKYPPTNGKYKVYIIDEVHMLSTDAFNALLKTLEEPPSHVIFILATTDTHKIPITILSRTQRFDFKRITINDIVDSMKDYLTQENIIAEDNALFYIAKLADGAMRDALSILEKCISFYFNEDLTLEKVLKITGAVDDDVFFYLTDKLVEFEVGDVLSLIDNIVQDGRDISKFITDAINHFRKLLIVKINNNKVNNNISSNNNIIYVSQDKLELFIKQADNIELEVITRLINYFLDMQNIIKTSFDKRIILEMYCIKICNAIGLKEEDEKNNLDYIDIQEKVKYLETKLEKVTNPIYQENPDMSSEQLKELIKKAEAYDNNINNNNNNNQDTIELELRELAVSEDIQDVIYKYKKLINTFDIPEKIYLDRALPKSLEDENLYLVIEDTFKNNLEKIIAQIQNNLFNIFKKQYIVKIMSKEEYAKEYRRVALSESPVNIDLDKLNKLNNINSVNNNKLHKEISQEISQEIIKGTSEELSLEKISGILPMDIVQID